MSDRTGRLDDRPAVPQAVSALVAAMLTGYAGLALGWESRDSFVIGCVVALLSGILAAYACFRVGRRPLSFHALFACFGVVSMCLATLWALWSLNASRVSLEGATVRDMTFRIVGEGKAATSGYRYVAIASDGTGTLGSVWVYVDQDLEPGMYVEGGGRVKIPTDDILDYMTRKGLAASVYLTSVRDTGWVDGLEGFVGKVRSALVGAIDPESSGGRSLIAGSIAGSTAALKDNGGSDAFSATGLSHLVAVSAGHLVVVASLADMVLERVHAGPRLRAVTIATLTGAYVLLCGCPVSARRAWIMSVTSLTSKTLGRRAHPLTACSVAGVAFCLADPTAANDLGLILSVACVMALHLLSPLVKSLARQLRMRARLRWLPKELRYKVWYAWSDSMELLFTSMLCALVSAPVTAAYFSQVSLLAPVANLFVAPLFEPFIALSFGACAACWIPVLGPVSLSLASGLGEVLFSLVSLLSSFPYACVSVEIPEVLGMVMPALIIVTLYNAWPKPRVWKLAAGACAVTLLGCTTWFVSGLMTGPRIVMLDVGQGDAILIRDGLSCVLVDTGPDEDGILEALARSGVARLDAVVVTHAHADHLTGLARVVSEYGVGTVLVAQGATDAVRQAAGLDDTVSFTELGHGDSFSVGRIGCEVVWPAEAVDGADNEDSLCLLVSYDDGSSTMTALMTGDAEREVEASIEADGDATDIDVLKVGHHGSAISLDSSTLEAFDPEVAIISAGEGNSYGHPTAECLSILEEGGVSVFCTIESGDITVEPGRDGVYVSCAA